MGGLSQRSPPIDYGVRRYDLCCMTRRLFLNLFLLFIAALSACGPSEPICQNEIIREAISPGGDMKAVLFHRPTRAT